MAHLIDKDALVAEIERRTDELWALIPDGEKVISDKHTKEDAFNLGKYTALESLDKFIDTLDGKEVDLKKLGEIARHLIAVKNHIEDMRLDSNEWLLLEKIGYPEQFKAKQGKLLQ